MEDGKIKIEDYDLNKASESFDNLISSEGFEDMMKKPYRRTKGMNEIQNELKEKIKKLQIDNNKVMGNLVDKKVVKAVIEDMARVVKGSFVDMPKIHAPKIAKILDAPEREGEIKKVLVDMIEDAINKIAKEIKDYA